MKTGIRGVATALSVSKQAALKRATKENWQYEEVAGRGGLKRLYKLSALPADVQAALAGKVLSAASTASLGSHPPLVGPASVDATLSSTRGVLEAAAAECPPQPQSGESPDPRSETLAAVFDAKPEGMKGDARARLAAVRAFHALTLKGFKRDAAAGAVCEEHKLSPATLSRYLALVRGKPEHVWLQLLCPRYVGRIAEAELSAEAWEYLKADYLRPERPSASACIARLRRAAAKHTWKVPASRTLLRKLNALPRQVVVMAREGRKAAMNLYPAQARSRAALQALSIVNTDGYLHNLFVLFPDGEILRPKTQFWQDVYSSKILAFRVDKTEHTDAIRLSFGDVVERYGIPEAVLLDNTLAAANKVMSGGIKHRFRFKVRDEEPLGVFPLLNVQVMWATPGHGQAKPVERAFGVGGIGEIVDKHPALAGAWTGANTLDKPEYDGSTRAVPIAELERVITEEVAAFNAREGRRSPMHQGRSFDALFSESYEQAPIRRATEAQRRLWLLAAEARTASRDGSITLETGRISRTQRAPTQANRYWHPDLIDHAGRQVVARFDPRRLHEGLHVYTLDGRYITYAECFAPQGFNDQVAAREHQRQRKTFIRATKQALEAERRMDVHEAAKFLPGPAEGAAAPSIPGPKVVRPEFRDPIERPRYQPAESSPEELAELAAIAAKPRAVSVVEMQSDAQKHDYWLELKRRADAGEELNDQERRHFAHWPTQDYYRDMVAAEREFYEGIARRQSA